MDSNFDPEKSNLPEGDSGDLSYLNMEEKAPEPEKTRKRMGFGAGMGFGVAIGLFAMAMVSIITVAVLVMNNRLTTAGSSGTTAAVENEVIDQDTADKMAEIESYLDAYYLEGVDKDAMQDELLHAMVGSLDDDYSVYYTESEFEDLMVSTSGTYAGIGAGLVQDETTMQVTVTEVYPDTPAEEAGLMVDDVILYVGDTDCTTESLTDIVARVRGNEGSTVHLTVYRPSTDETFDLDIERRSIVLTSVYYQMMDNNIGYIQITEFQSKTTEQWKAALADLESQGMTSLIVDLRDNPGGYLDTVVAVLDTILPEGTVVYTEDKYGNRKDYTSDAECIDYPMVVLVNENSASASEIFSGAIQDYGYGTLIGTTTFGKGIVQSLYKLSDGDGLKITTAKYYTPNGNNIQGEGITPDIELEYEFLGTEDQSYDISLDNQIQYAIEYLSK